MDSNVSKFSTAGIASFYGFKTEDVSSPPKTRLRLASSPLDEKLSHTQTPLSDRRRIDKNERSLSPDQSPGSARNRPTLMLRKGGLNPVQDFKLQPNIWEHDQLKLESFMWEQMIGKLDNGALGPEIIDLFMKLKSSQKIANFHFTSSTFYDRVASDYNVLLEYFEKNDLFAVEKLFIPIKMPVKDTSKWVLVITNLKEQLIDFYDPYNTDIDDTKIQYLRRVFKEILKHSKRTKTRKSSFRNSTLKSNNLQNLIQISNINDSGVFILDYMNCSCKDIDLENGDNRKNLALEIIFIMESINPIEMVMKNILTKQAEALATLPKKR